MDILKETAEKIRRLEIQGATKVAISSLEAVSEYAKAKKVNEIRKGIDILLATRPTEPLMINTLSVLKRLEDPFEISERAIGFRSAIKTGMKEIVDIGSRLIEYGMTIQTICHSSTVVEILKQAKNESKKIKVVNTETRPLYQGRKTAEELYKGGVPVVMYADSAMYTAMKKEDVDLALVGVDAIFMDGSIANKIGTGLLALAAEALEVPFYPAGLALKLDRGSLMANSVKIEERDPREIWSYPINIRNPAFEIVPAKRIKGIITELGILPPATAHIQIETAYQIA
jgi:ribose 1,5-bisphosphate isomerase